MPPVTVFGSRIRTTRVRRRENLHPKPNPVEQRASFTSQSRSAQRASFTQLSSPLRSPVKNLGAAQGSDVVVKPIDTSIERRHHYWRYGTSLAVPRMHLP